MLTEEDPEALGVDCSENLGVVWNCCPSTFALASDLGVSFRGRAADRLRKVERILEALCDLCELIARQCASANQIKQVGWNGRREAGRGHSPDGGEADVVKRPAEG